MTWGCSSSQGDGTTCLRCSHDSECRALVAAHRPVLCEDDEGKPSGAWRYGPQLMDALSRNAMTAAELSQNLDINKRYVRTWCFRQYQAGAIRVAGYKDVPGNKATRIYAVLPPGDAMTA